MKTLLYAICFSLLIFNLYLNFSIHKKIEFNSKALQQIKYKTHSIVPININQPGSKDIQNNTEAVNSVLNINNDLTLFIEPEIKTLSTKKTNLSFNANHSNPNKINDENIENLINSINSQDLIGIFSANSPIGQISAIEQNKKMNELLQLHKKGIVVIPHLEDRANTIKNDLLKDLLIKFSEILQLEK